MPSSSDWQNTPGGAGVQEHPPGPHLETPLAKRIAKQAEEDLRGGASPESVRETIRDQGKALETDDLGKVMAVVRRWEKAQKVARKAETQQAKPSTPNIERQERAKPTTAAEPDPEIQIKAARAEPSSEPSAKEYLLPNEAAAIGILHRRVHGEEKMGDKRAVRMIANNPAIDRDRIEFVQHVARRAFELSRQRDLAGFLNQYPSRPPIETPPVRALLGKTFALKKWAVPDIVCEGINLLVGPPKRGKSRLALDIAIAAAAGGKAMGRIPVEQGDVLYISLEDSEERLQQRILRMGREEGEDATPEEIAAAESGDSFQDRMFYEIEWPRLDDGGLEELAKWIEKHPLARLIVIDTWQKVRPRMKTGSAYADDYDAVTPIHRLARERRLAVILVHHSRKGAANDDDVEAVLGTHGLAGSADAILRLKDAMEGEADAVLGIQGRDIERQELALRDDTVNLGWTLMGDAADYALADTRSYILDAVRRHRKVMPVDVFRTVNAARKRDGDDKPLARSTIRRLMNDMAQPERGILIRNRDGSYSVASRPRLSSLNPPEQGEQIEHGEQGEQERLI